MVSHARLYKAKVIKVKSGVVHALPTKYPLDLKILRTYVLLSLNIILSWMHDLPRTLFQMQHGRVDHILSVNGGSLDLQDNCSLLKQLKI